MLQLLLCFCPEIRVTKTAVAAVLVVHAQRTSAKDSSSLHTVRACCCSTHSHLHRGRHYNQQRGSRRRIIVKKCESHTGKKKALLILLLFKDAALKTCNKLLGAALLNPRWHEVRDHTRILHPLQRVECLEQRWKQGNAVKISGLELLLSLRLKSLLTGSSVLYRTTAWNAPPSQLVPKRGRKSLSLKLSLNVSVICKNAQTLN